MDSLAEVETMARFERDRSSPFKWETTVKKNLFGVFQIWNYKPLVVFKEFRDGMPGSADVVIPEQFPVAISGDEGPKPQQIDTFFFVMEKPVSYQRVQIESFGHLIPKHDWYFTTEKTAILYMREPLSPTMTIFEVRFVV